MHELLENIVEDNFGKIIFNVSMKQTVKN